MALKECVGKGRRKKEAIKVKRLHLGFLGESPVL